MKFRLTRKKIILLILLLLLLLFGRPAGFLLYNYFKDQPPVHSEKPGFVNDASQLNETRTALVLKVSETEVEAISQIVSLIRKARKEGKKISIAGAQHSMGGHTIYPDGIMLDMKGFHSMKLDNSNNVLVVGSGALWSDIIPFLDSYGKSIAVMQSNNSFSVGGSVSVNCHGWQPDSPPIAATVESFRLIDANGNLLNCSKNENPELFALVLGGYGLFGVILDLRLILTDNKMYRLNQYIMKSDDYISRYDELVKDKSKVGMVYGRINVNPDHFMEEAILSVFSTDEKTISPLKKGRFTGLRRTVFRSSANSNYGKNLRWRSEKLAARIINNQTFSRNQLQNEGVEVFQNTRAGFTDILQEYFIPKDSVTRFIHAVQKIIPSYKTDLLNITLRNVRKDEQSFLSYAREEVFGFVMLFNQLKNEAAEKEMRLLTRELIDSAIVLRGTYYLPYRLHATKEQLNKAYPNAASFFSLKKKYDPEEIFQNRFYETYKQGCVQ